MGTHTIEVKVHMGNKRRPIRTWDPLLSTDDLEVDMLGSIWGERQILHLGAHLDLYTNYMGRGTWGIGNRIGTLPPNILAPSMEPAMSKLPGSSVSGNFGEVLTILALQSRIKGRDLRICHLCPVRGGPNIKCPDLLLESAPLADDYDIFRGRFDPRMCSRCGRRHVNPVPLPNLPLFMPGECKNSNSVGALRQLASYWKEVGDSSPVYGFGLISTVRYQRPPALKLRLLVPVHRAGLTAVLASKVNADLGPADFRGCVYGF
jgi:hypothetical protein